METVVRNLAALVGFDTRNPPRALDADSPIFAWLRDSLGAGFSCEVTDHGKGRVSFYARRGQPQVLFNVHLDTVPALEGSRFPPLELNIEHGKAWGRGACDIKGAAACLLTLAGETRAPLALLFTTDEEGGEGCCVDEFLRAGHADGYAQVIVAEPSQCRAEFRHRGFLSARGQFRGISGHSSEPRALADNAIHRLARWSAAAVREAELAAESDNRTCFNIGTVSGGVKSNIIADQAAVFWSARLAPGESNDAFLQHLVSLEGGEHARWVVSFSGPPLPSAGYDDRQARAFAARHGLPCGDGLDFWTEASLFGAHGIPALVLGPGDIAQAHVVDEWVSLEQLEQCLGLYRTVVQNND